MGILKRVCRTFKRSVYPFVAAASLYSSPIRAQPPSSPLPHNEAERVSFVVENSPVAHLKSPGGTISTYVVNRERNMFPIITVRESVRIRVRFYPLLRRDEEETERTVVLSIGDRKEQIKGLTRNAHVITSELLEGSPFVVGTPIEGAVDVVVPPGDSKQVRIIKPNGFAEITIMRLPPSPSPQREVTERVVREVVQVVERRESSKKPLGLALVSLEPRRGFSRYFANGAVAFSFSKHFFFAVGTNLSFVHQRALFGDASSSLSIVGGAAGAGAGLLVGDHLFLALPMAELEYVKEQFSFDNRVSSPSYLRPAGRVGLYYDWFERLSLFVLIANDPQLPLIAHASLEIPFFVRSVELEASFELLKELEEIREENRITAETSQYSPFVSLSLRVPVLNSQFVPYLYGRISFEEGNLAWGAGLGWKISFDDLSLSLSGWYDSLSLWGADVLLKK